MSLPVNQIVRGHAVEVLKTFPSESVDMVVTSPPYTLSGLGLEGVRNRSADLGWQTQL